MKKILLLFVAFTAFFISCKNDDGDDVINPVKHNVKVSFGENYNNADAENVTVTFLNLTTNTSETAVTDTKGMITVELMPGTYSINAALTLTPQQYEQKFGQASDSDVSFGATLNTLTIKIGVDVETTNLVLETGRIGDLLFSQIYYAGSDVQKGAIYRDVFYQIHNNSNETMYLDGLCVAQIYGATSVKSGDDYTSDGQYDWGKSVGNTAGDTAMTDYVYSDEVLRFPGTKGSTTQYPIASGESVIIAATAVNHKAPFVGADNDGNPVDISVEDPSLTIDLSNAPFEAYFRDFRLQHGQRPESGDVDNPNSVNMEIAWKYTGTGARDLILDAFGRDAFVLFYAEQSEIDSWTVLALPTVDNPTATSLKYKQVPANIIIDGVMLDRVDPSKHIPTRLPVAIDADGKAGIKGRYSSEAIIRKVKGTNGNKVFYVDTNNSENDFEVIERPKVN